MRPAPLAASRFLRSPTHVSEPKDASARGSETREGCAVPMGPGRNTVERRCVYVAARVAAFVLSFQRLTNLYTVATRFARARIGDQGRRIDAPYARAQVRVVLVYNVTKLLIYIKKEPQRVRNVYATPQRGSTPLFRSFGANLLNIKGFAHG